MELSKLLSRDTSVLSRAHSDSYKLGLDLKKTQTLAVLPKSADYVLSSSLLNQISEASYLTPSVIRNYEARMAEADQNDQGDQSDQNNQQVESKNTFNIDMLV